MKERQVRSAPTSVTLAVAGIICVTPLAANPASAEDLEATTDVATVAAAVRYSDDWLNGRLDDAEYNMPEITYEGDPVTLRWSHHVTPVGGFATNVFMPGLRLLEKLSEGKIRVEEHWGGTVHAAEAGYDATRSGLTDMTACFAFYDPEAFDLLHVMSLPGIVPSSPAGTRITHEAYDEFFRREMERTGVLMGMVYTTTPYVLHSKDALDTLESLDGKRVRTGGGVHAAVWEALGAVPTTIPAPSIYTAFERGLLDAVAFPDANSVQFRIYEIQKSHTYINLSRINQEHCVRREWFEALPPDLKEVMSRWVQGVSQAISQQFYVLGDARARDKLRENGINMVQLSDAEAQRWQAAARPVIEEWIRVNEAKGLPARELMEFINRRAAEYADMSPEQIMKMTIAEPVGNFIGE